MAAVVCRIRPSIHAAYSDQAEQIGVSVKSVYDKLAGMTGTAMTEASEFDKIYGLGVVPIPTNRDMVRLDKPDFIYRTVDADGNVYAAEGPNSLRWAGGAFTKYGVR